MVWGGYEECCGHRKEMLVLFQCKEQKKEALVEKENLGKDRRPVCGRNRAMTRNL